MTFKTPLQRIFLSPLHLPLLLCHSTPLTVPVTLRWNLQKCHSRQRPKLQALSSSADREQENTQFQSSSQQQHSKSNKQRIELRAMRTARVLKTMRNSNRTKREDGASRSPKKSRGLPTRAISERMLEIVIMRMRTRHHRLNFNPVSWIAMTTAPC